MKYVPREMIILINNLTCLKCIAARRLILFNSLDVLIIGTEKTKV